MTVIREVGGTVVPVIVDDLDTDRILPVLRCVTFDGLESMLLRMSDVTLTGSP